MRQVFITAIALLLLGGCKEPLLEEIKIPDCPGAYKAVQVINGTVSGEDLDNLLDNVLADRACISQLKTLLGDKKIKQLIKHAPKSHQTKLFTLLGENSLN